MNHGGLGVITGNEIVLPQAILSPLSICEGAVVEGFYYPDPHELAGGGEDYTQKNRAHDVLLTPIPRELWAVVGRFKIHLRHEPGSMNRVANWFHAKRATVLSAECTRSAHRFATWNVVVSLDDLLDNIVQDEYPYSKKKSVYPLVQLHFEKLEESLRKEDGLKGALFSDPTEERREFSVSLQLMNTLYYFHHLWKRRRHDPELARHGKEWLATPFRLRCRRGRLVADDERLSALMCHAFGPGIESECGVFSEMFWEDMVIRNAVIPPAELSRFYSVSVQYTRTHPPSSSRGLLKGITESLPTGCQVWRIENHTYVNRPERESGSVLLFMEMPTFGGHYRLKRKSIVEMFESVPCPENMAIQSVSVKRLQPSEVMRSIEDETDSSAIKFDVFISYSERDGHLAHALDDALKQSGLKPYLASKTMQGGQVFSEEIRLALRSSAEICIVYSPHAAESQWVHTEWGAAWAMGKRTVCLMHRVDVDRLPDRLRATHVLDFHDYPKYVEQVKTRYIDRSFSDSRFRRSY